MPWKLSKTSRERLKYIRLENLTVYFQQRKFNLKIQKPNQKFS